ncbi:hypothetical protein LF41_2413 [Lysobacter dokdonensis DS-58]|uniref:Uncharacterized protein n=1 Tax=Lysobacter dokdonensis DS-58 TaxID=1300345 RepID=A0A0A2WI90_9GAMM|nr:hypothetical protein [Lysobacter dokdonensis]KGQ19906.1 hypothetical protein LF41_2413 [Lysobacter dokdonensis DS-58]
MTTAAIADGVVAADTQLTGGNYAVRVAKMVRLPDGGVAVGCGLWRNAWAGLQWLAGGEKGDPPDLDGAQIAVVRPDGAILLADESFPLYPIMESSYALGCGADLARKAMADGKDPVQAVAEACELDAVSSGPIMRMKAQAIEFDAPTLHEVKRGRRPAR